MKRVPGLQYDSPYAFTLKQRITLAVAPPVISTAMRLLIGATRVEVRGQEIFDNVVCEGPVLLAFWHECMAFAAHRYQGTGYHTLTSYSMDGEMAARICRWMGMEAIRGSSSKGGSIALAGLVEALPKVGLIGLTLDGPRGPRRVAKAGIAILSARTQTAVVPHAFAVSESWRLRSWDRLPVPKPGARLIVAYGAPVLPAADEQADTIESKRLEIETALNALHREIELELGQTQIPGEIPLPH